MPSDHRGHHQHEGGARDPGGFQPVEAQGRPIDVEHSQVRDVRMSVGGMHVRGEA